MKYIDINVIVTIKWLLCFQEINAVVFSTTVWMYLTCMSKKFALFSSYEVLLFNVSDIAMICNKLT